MHFYEDFHEHNMTRRMVLALAALVMINALLRIIQITSALTATTPAPQIQLPYLF